MSTFLRWMGLVLIFAVVGCSEEEKPQNNNDLKSYLNGLFTIDKVSYDGKVDFVITTLPVSGEDPNARGAYYFNAEDTLTSYLAEGTLTIKPPFGQGPIEVPIEVTSRNAPFRIIDESSFEITDDTWGLMRYTVNSRTDKTLVASTTLASDSAGFDMTMRIDFIK